ncbi:MAG: hypothetical protein PHF57_05055 [Methanoregula sp.]|nr:hypothetical protein [Methanoregula sp.]
MSEITAATSGFLIVLGRYRVDATTSGAVDLRRCTYQMKEVPGQTPGQDLMGEITSGR